MEKQSKGVGFPIFLVLIVVCVFMYMYGIVNEKKETINYDEFVKVLDNSDTEITKVHIIQNNEVPTGVVEITFKGGTKKFVNVLDTKEVEKLLIEKFPSYTIDDVKRDGIITTYIFPALITVVIVVIAFMLITGGAGGGSNAKMMNFTKNKAKLLSEDNKVRFSNVAGLEEEKEELEEIADFLKNPSKYTAVGARIPKGVILVGSPGTGKTLIAKAVAGEAGVPFFSISGSDFVEMFVGVGAARVRDLFAEAKTHAPCIVFIDEIDAVARRRGTGMGGGHDEREQTLNQLLVEMDGFAANEGIIVLAATNRVDILDPAIMRPGRFDRKVYVGYPDIKGRKEILTVHVKDKPLSEDVDLDQIAQTTAGFTGADLENLMNEAAINAARSDRKYIVQADIKEAFFKIGVGQEKKSKVVSEEEKKITAYHEAGHAILFHVLPKMDSVYTVSIIPTGSAGGYTMPLPEKDDMYNTKEKILQNITVSLGGRVAESIVFGDITTGASSDIKKATKLAKEMVTRYGMSDEIGVICYDNDEDEVFIGKDLAHARGYSETIAAKIDLEIKTIIDKCYADAERIINENIEVLHKCAELLIEKEKIGKEEFEKLFVHKLQKES